MEAVIRLLSLLLSVGAPPQLLSPSTEPGWCLTIGSSVGNRPLWEQQRKDGPDLRGIKVIHAYLPPICDCEKCVNCWVSTPGIHLLYFPCEAHFLGVVRSDKTNINQGFAIPCIVKRMLIGDQGNCNSGRCKPKFTFVSTSAASNTCGQGFSQQTLPAASIFNLINHSVNNNNLGEPLYGCVCAYQHYCKTRTIQDNWL